MTLCPVVPSFPHRRESKTFRFFGDWIADNGLGNDNNRHCATDSSVTAKFPRSPFCRRSSPDHQPHTKRVRSYILNRSGVFPLHNPITPHGKVGLGVRKTNPNMVARSWPDAIQYQWGELMAVLLSSSILTEVVGAHPNLLHRTMRRKGGTSERFKICPL